MEQFPVIQEGHFVVIMADGATGHILLESGPLATGDADHIFRIFSSIEEATKYIIEKQRENNTREFVLKDYKENLIKYFPAIRWSSNMSG